jgi:hypothetical protein
VVGLIPKLTSGEALASLMDGQGEPSITLDIEGAKVVKERTTLAFRTSWRGDAAVIRMEASRSRDGSGLGEWWVWADQVHSGDQRFGSEVLSDTARSRLSPLYEPAVNEWGRTRISAGISAWPRAGNSQRDSPIAQTARSFPRPLCGPRSGRDQQRGPRPRVDGSIPRCS